MGRGTSAMIETLYELAQEYRVEIVERSHGQFQIKGPLTVNYFPFSAHRLAHISGTIGPGKRGIDPLAAVMMAISVPDLVQAPVKHRNGRNKRRKLIRAGHTECRWCNDPLTLENSTLEHVIPLARGGADRPHNWALACLACNEKRGHHMPEVASWLPSDPVVEEVMPVAPVSGTEASLQSKKLSLELVRATLNANFAKVDLDFTKATTKRAQEALRAERRKLTAEIQMTKAELLAVNSRLSEIGNQRFQATFKSVAKSMLSPDLFEQILAESIRLTEAITLEETHE